MKRIFAAINKTDFFSPYIFFPFVLVAYFVISLFDFGRIEYFEAERNIFISVLLALVSYLLAVYLVRKGKVLFPRFGLSFLQGKMQYFLYALGLVGLISYSIMIFTGQIGITDESVRRHLDPKLNFLAALLWFSALFIISQQIIKLKEITKKKLAIYYGILFFVFGLFVLLGYRTTMAIMLFSTFIVFHYVIKKINTTVILSILATLVLAFSLFGFFRIVTEDTTQPHNNRDGPQVERTEKEIDRDLILIRKINETPKWVRALSSESVTGRIVLSKLMDYTDQHGFMKGSLHYNVFGTVLPGEQVSPRMQVTEMVNSLSVQEGKYITRPGRTTTPTLIGQFYVEFGYVAVALGFALFGAIMGMLYNHVERAGFRSYETITFAFVSSVFVLSIHTGLLDLIFILMIGYAILSMAIEQPKKNKQI